MLKISRIYLRQGHWRVLGGFKLERESQFGLADNTSIKSTVHFYHLCLSQFQLGTSPGQPPGISSKNLPGGSRFDFWDLPGGREFDKDRDFVENESETSQK